MELNAYVCPWTIPLDERAGLLVNVGELVAIELELTRNLLFLLLVEVKLSTLGVVVLLVEFPLEFCLFCSELGGTFGFWVFGLSSAALTAFACGFEIDEVPAFLVLVPLAIRITVL